MSGHITYEPTRDHWTPYEPWMRDALADDVRVSWLTALDTTEVREPWYTCKRATDVWLAESGARVHPDAAPERPTEHEHAWSRHQNVTTKGHVMTAYETCDCGEARPAEDDADEALAEAEGRIADLECRVKRAESDLADMTLQRDALGRMADHNHDVAAKVKADRDGWCEDAIRNGEDRNKWMTKYAEMRRERNEWKARHAALREDVDEFQYKHREYPGTWELVDALGRDIERGAK